MGRIAEPVRARITRGIKINEDTGCWEWQGAKNARGYGRIAMPSGKMGGYRDSTHRVSYEEYVGPIPDGMVLDHLCRNPSCCNPEHLEAVTQKVNLRRGDTFQAANLLKTHCPHGHEYTPENTRRVARGRRCRACERRRSNEHNARKRASV